MSVNSDLPFVSIITPTYNHANFIEKCLDSVKKQTFGNWEQIIIDDGSNDGTLDIIRNLTKNDLRFKVHTQKNVGIFRLNETYNYALSVAQGKYIAILEGDDMWYPRKLEIQIAEMESNEDCVVSWGRADSFAVYSDSFICTTPNETEDLTHFNNDPVGSILSRIFFKNVIPALTIVIRKDALLEVGGFLQSHNLPLVDGPTTCNLALKGRFKFIEESLGIWNHYSEQVTKTHTYEMYEGLYNFRKEFYLKNSIELKGVFILDIGLFEKQYEKDKIISASRQGRYCLIRREFVDARKYYKISIFTGGFQEIGWKVRSLIGIAFSYFRMDIERLADVFGSGRLK